MVLLRIACPFLFCALSGIAIEEPFVLLDGTPVKLKLNRNLSSADARVGETADFEVLEDVKIGDVVVIPKNGSALATVTEAQPKRRLGRGGKLNVNIDYVRLVNGDKAALRAVKETKGGGHTGAMTGAIVATSIVFFPAAPLFLFMHGKDITIPKGTEITAYVNGDMRLEPAQFRKPSQAEPAPPSVATAQRATTAKAMTNEDVIALKQAGLSDDLIVAKIKESPAAYRLEVEDLVKLKQAPLSETVIRAMIEAAKVVPR